MRFSSRLVVISVVVLVASSRGSDAQQILFTNNASYVDTTVNPPVARVALNGYVNAVVKNNATYKNVGIVLSNSYSTYNDIYNPAANANGTTFGYASNTPYGTLPTSFSWASDIALPLKGISTDPSNPSYITVSFYLVDNAGKPYNNGPFSTYCFMTYISAGKVMTSPAGGPYIIVSPPTGNARTVKQGQPASMLSFPVPPVQDVNLQGSFETRTSDFPVRA